MTSRVQGDGNGNGLNEPKPIWRRPLYGLTVVSGVCLFAVWVVFWRGSTFYETIINVALFASPILFLFYCWWRCRKVDRWANDELLTAAEARKVFAPVKEFNALWALFVVFLLVLDFADGPEPIELDSESSLTSTMLALLLSLLTITLVNTWTKTDNAFLDARDQALDRVESEG